MKVLHEDVMLGISHDPCSPLQMLEFSRLRQEERLGDIPSAPVFHPTLEQWADPILYIQQLHQVAAQYGELHGNGSDLDGQHCHSRHTVDSVFCL